MASILDNIRSMVTPGMLSDASALTGTSESALGKGLGAAIPGILSALANRSDDSGFMKQLGSLALGTSESDPLAAAKAFMTPSNAAIDTTTPMGNWLSGLFGHNFSSVTNALAQYAGVRSASAASLLSIGASVVLGYLGRLMRSDRLDANALASRLRSERAEYAAAMPAGFNMPGFVKEAPRRYDTAVAVPERRAGSWAVPLLLTALALGTLAWWANRYRPEQTISRVTESTSKAVGTSGVRISEMLTRALPGNVNITIPRGGMEDNLANYAATPSAAASSTFTFDRIAFMSGSSSLTEQSREQIENVAAILRAYPGVQVTVGGHSDNVGNSSANMSLSTARAEAVADALAKAGVTADRVRPEGYGDSRPIADNSTEAGRAQNRRVTLDVTDH